MGEALQQRVASAPPRPSTRSQQERYERMLDVTLDLLDEGGVAGLQVREVSARADVALGTLYRYFPSKDYLLVRALNHWSERQSRRSRSTAGVAPDLDVALRAISRAFASHPSYAAAAVQVSSSTDPLVPSALDEYRASFAAVLDGVLVDLPEGRRDDVRFVVESVLIAQLVGFTSQRNTPAQMEAALQRAVRLVVPGRGEPRVSTEDRRGS